MHSNFVVMSPALPAMTIWWFAPHACFFPRQIAQPKVRLTLRKEIPHGAGLGGGSSDAAAALRGLNRFFDARLSSEKLMTLAAQFGSDVSFFVNETAATCSGRGEIVKPATLPAPLSLLLLKSEFGVPSSWAYSRWQATREAAGEIYQSQKFGDITFVNDLERPVFEKFVFLAQREIVVTQTTGSWRCVNVGVRFDDFRGFALQCRWRFGCEARKVRARSRIVVVRLRHTLIPGSARVSRAGERVLAIANFASASIRST